MCIYKGRGTIQPMDARSYLYVPGDNGEMLERAPERDADALILDLEDAVAIGAKDRAREQVARWIVDRASGVGCEIWVRVNPESRLSDDVSAVVHPGLGGIVLPKATDAALHDADVALRRAERAAGLTNRDVPVVALIESASGIIDLRAISQNPRVAHLALGEVDLSADLGIEPSLGEPELQPLRLALVVESAAAGKAPPIGPVSTDIRDREAFRESTERLRRLGYRSRQAIHPTQVHVANEVFSPSAEDLARARQLVERFDAAVQAGRGVIIDEDGRMIDEAIVRVARLTLARAGSDGAKQSAQKPGEVV